MRSLIFVIGIILATQAVGETQQDPSNLSVSVNLIDAARGGCWTNLKEVRDLTEKNLSKLGFKLNSFNLSETNENRYVFDIFVKANRYTFDNDSFCDGGVSISFKTQASVNGLIHSAQLAGFTNSGINPDWNDTTIYLVNLVIKQIENHFG